MRKHATAYCVVFSTTVGMFTPPPPPGFLPFRPHTIKKPRRTQNRNLARTTGMNTTASRFSKPAFTLWSNLVSGLLPSLYLPGKSSPLVFTRFMALGDLGGGGDGLLAAPDACAS